MTLLATGVLCAAAVTLYVGLYHLLLFLGMRERREHLAFAVCCYAATLYDLFSAGLYLASSSAEGAVFQRWQFLALTGLAPAAVWFTSAFVGQRHRAVEILFYTYFAIEMLLILYAPDPLVLSAIPAVKDFTLFDLHVRYNEVQPGILAGIQGGVAILAGAYIMWLLIGSVRTGQRRSAVPIVVGMGILALGAVNDTLVGVGLYQSLYIMEYTYLALLLAMGYTLVSTLVLTQKDLRRSEERYRYLLNNVPDLIYETDAEGRVTSANEYCMKLSGYRTEEVIGRHFLEFIHPDDRGRVAAAYAELLCGHRKEHRDLSYRVCAKDGRIVWVSLNARAAYDAQGRYVREQGVIRDVTDIQRAHDELARLAAAVNAAAESIIITDTAGRIQYVNPCFERMTGYRREEVLGKPTSILSSGRHDRAFYHQLWDAIQHGETWHGRFTNRRKNGTLFEEEAVISPVSDTAGQVVSFVAVKRDITQELSLEKQLRHSQTMEALGRMARGVAHDFTNKLLVILQSAEFVQKELPQESICQEFLHNITSTCKLAADLTGQLLAFSHQQAVSLRETDLNRVVRGLADLIRRTVTHKVSVVIETGPEPAWSLIDAGQIEQAVLHLVINACDAMRDGGHLTVEVQAANLGPAEVAQFEETERSSGRPAGDVAVIAVSDSGMGMTADVRSHVFEPFFTTKGTDHSTGLGLSTVYGILRQHGGRASTYSVPGKGSTFRLLLPLSRPLPPAPAVPAAPFAGTVLVATDDAPGRRCLIGILSALGVPTLEVEDGREALDLIATRPSGTIQALMIDMFMPQRESAVLSLRDRCGNIPIILLSGFTRHHLTATYAMAEHEILLCKPFARGDVEQVLQSVLGAPGETRA